MAITHKQLQERIVDIPAADLQEVADFIDFIVIKRKQPDKKPALRQQAIDEAFGMWKEHDNSLSVEETVRALRRGRKFDI